MTRFIPNPLPSSTEKTLAAAALSALCTLWLGFDPLIKTLLTLMVLDFASGIIVALAIQGKLCSTISYLGMGKKSMMLILVGAAYAFDATNDLGFKSAVAVAGFFSITEMISIVENAAKLKLPVQWLLDTLEKAKTIVTKEKPNAGTEA